MNNLKTLAHAWLPPALVRWINHLRGGGNRFVGEYATWDDASKQCSGYDADDILEKVLASTLKVKRGEAVFERDSVIFDEIEYVWPVLTGLMWAASRNGGQLNVLDFGGSLGSSYFQNRKFLQALPRVTWNIVEQPHYADAGKQYIQDEHLRFYENIDDCLSENYPNVILLSSVLQYLEKPYDLIKKLSGVEATCLIIDRTPFFDLRDDKILVQRVPASIYSASYPMWVFSTPKLLQALERNWRLIVKNQSLGGKARSTNGCEFVFNGLLLELKA